MIPGSSLSADANQLDNIVFRHIPAGLCVFDCNGELIEINGACLDILGITDVSAISNTGAFMSLIIPEDFKKVLINNSSVNFEKKLDFADPAIRRILDTSRHTTIDISVHLDPVADEKKGVYWIICMIQDITKLTKEREALRISAERWQFAIENVSAGLWDWDTENNRVYFSRQWKLTLGYEEYEIGNTFDEWKKRVHPDDIENVKNELNNYICGKSSIYQCEFRMLCKDGSYKWISAQGKTILKSADGRPLRIIGIHRDITEKYKMAEVIKEHEDFYRNLFDHHMAVKLIIDPSDGSIINANNAAIDFYGWPLEKFRKMKLQDITLTEDENSGLVNVSSISDDRLYSEYKHRLADGSIRDVEIINSKLVSNGKPYHFVIVHDITIRKQNEAAIKLDDERLESLFKINQYSSENVNELLDVVLNDAIKLTGSSIGYLYFYDEEKKEFTLSAWSKDVMAECAVKEKKTICQLEKTGAWGEVVRRRKPVMINNFNAPSPMKKGYPAGHMALTKFLSVPVFYDNRIVAVIGVANKKADYNDSDIRQLVLTMDTVWKIVERRSADEKNRLLVDMLDNAPNSIVIYDKDGTFLYANQKTFSLYGYTKEEFMQLNLHKIDAPESYEMVENRDALIEKKGEASFEVWHYNKSGSPFPVEVFIKKVSWGGKPAYLSIATDMTARKISEIEQERLNKQLNQMQKLKSLGVLAGGIAHDFNNLLGGVFGYIEIAKESTHEAEVSDYLTKASGAIDRARRLTQQLLTFAKGGAPVKQVGQLFPFIEDTARFAMSGAAVAIKFDVEADLWMCDFDRNQIGQVIENIVINAVQAMPDGGTLNIDAENVSFSEDNIVSGLAAGDYVKITFQDTGVGIPEEIISRVFDPFFTTKPMGHGLGLATSFSIISRHGGAIDVKSVHGKGSTFDVYLPASKIMPELNIAETPSNLPASGKIILMDDEELMLETTSKILKSMGFEVVCKKNGREALEYFVAELKADRPVAAMIFDLTVPGGMGGRETIVEVRKLSQDIPVFVSSGYADDPVMARPKDFGFTASICKPFNKKDLERMLGVV